MTDDDVPATPAWVRAIPEPQQSLIPSWQYGGTRTVRTLRVYIRVGVGELMLTNPTRGQIRRVFADIGVPLPAVEQPVAVVSDSDRGPATADGQPWKGV